MQQIVAIVVFHHLLSYRIQVNFLFYTKLIKFISDRFFGTVDFVHEPGGQSLSFFTSDIISLFTADIISLFLDSDSTRHLTLDTGLV